ncbi:uncharacterized protein [Mytilus edulis]|uniref:uncharacterized protein n=1 Tax=Mytilus edulis TaxID=6550 RepID=UPI0039F07EA2
MVPSTTNHTIHSRIVTPKTKPGGSTGVTCGNSPEVCSIINPCTVMGTCKDKEGTAQCNCTGEYAGTSCQLIKDHCSDPDMCNNGGQCVTKPIGFECECGDSYSGSTCSMYTDPCSSNPCHDQAKCVSNKDKYMCYCEQGNVLTDNGCKDTLGRISKLRIYKTFFHDIDIYKAKDNTSHLPSDQLIQGWTNIKLTWSTFKKVPSGAGNDNVCDINFPNCLDDDKTKPNISCPDDQIKIGTERLTAFTGLKNSYNKNEDVQYVNTSVHYDELYTYGSNNEVFIGYDEALNYGICRFKVYVKYADCPRPETNADISYCPNSKHICELNCPSGEALCIKHKQKYRCGALGVYNFEHPRKKLILPTCGGQHNQTIALSVSLTYKTVTNCVPTFPSNIKTGLEVKLRTDLPNLWPMGAGMTWCGSQCIWDAICRGTSTYIDVTFTLHVPQLSASIERNGKTYKIREALFIFILQENGLNFNNVAGAQLERDSVNIDESSSCPDGYMVVRKQCVECGKGTYRNDTTMTCAFCAIGSYQTNVGRTVCEPCESSKTTLNFGSDSSTDCIDNCPPGSVPNSSDSGKISGDMANTGIMIGLSIGLVLLLCIVVSVVIVYKRLTSDSDYSVPIDNNQYQVQSHEHHYDEMTNKSQQYLNVGSIPHSHGLSNNGYENDDDNYATITEILSGNSSSNNEYFELYEKPTETENI